jgi:lipoprotein-releasing system permease protein
VNSWILFVARRLVQSGRSRRRGAAGLAVLGITAGTATLVVVLSVMNGFQLGTIENILELNSFHLRVESGKTAGDVLGEPEEDRLDVRLDRAMSSQIRSVTPFVEVQTLARGYWPEPQGVVIRGVPPQWLQQDEGAASQIEIAGGDFDLSSPEHIVLGTELARALGVRVGDGVAVTHIPPGGSRPEEVRLQVVGLFRSGYLDFDRNWGFVSLEGAVVTLNAMDPVTYGIKLDDRYAVDRTGRAVEEFLQEWTADGHNNSDGRNNSAGPSELGGYTIQTWREFNRGIFGALRMEKTMMVLLVGLIFLVVAGNIYQLLRRSILERSEEIAIIRAIGAGARDVRRVFVLEGWFIGVVGTVLGLLVGLFISGNLNEIFALLEWVARTLGAEGMRLFSPTYFYLDRIPLRIFSYELFGITFGSIGISVGAARIASGGVVNIRPMELLRNE